MGLLSHMEALHAAEKQNKIHSVTCSAFSSTEKILDFHQFAEMLGLKKCAILVPFGKRYFMRYSHGLDANTVCKSISTKGFWDGTFPGTQNWTFFANAALQPYFQLFSEEIVSTLEQIRIKSFIVLADIPVRVIFLSLDNQLPEISDTLIQNLSTFIAQDIANISDYSFPAKNGTTQEKSRIFKIKINDAIDEVLESIDYEAQSILFSVIFSEIFNTIKSILPDGDCCDFKDGEIIIKLNYCETLDSDLLQFHLQKLLFPILGNSSDKVTTSLNNEVNLG